jgi:diguanylate cyclase
MEARRFDDFDTAAEAVLAMLRERLARDCRLVNGPIGDDGPFEPELAIDLVCDADVVHASIVVSQGEPPLSAADRALVEQTARLLTSLVDADLRIAIASAEAETDPLTGLANRRGWQRSMESFDHNRPLGSSPGGGSVVLSAVDIEGLKEWNDLHGHVAGDELLRRAATALESACGSGHAARIGGDEFAVWCTVDPGQSVDETAANLRSALAAAGVSAAIGSVRYDGTRSTAETYAEADLRMVAEKRRKRGG